MGCRCSGALPKWEKFWKFFEIGTWHRLG